MLLSMRKTFTVLHLTQQALALRCLGAVVAWLQLTLHQNTPAVHQSIVAKVTQHLKQLHLLQHLLSSCVTVDLDTFQTLQVCMP